MGQDNSLKHYGVKGMKWGVRRTQEELDIAAGRIPRTRRGRRRQARQMSDKELRSRINRLNMERQYSQLTAREKSTGQRIVENVIVGGTTVVATEYFKQHLKKVADPYLKVKK